MKSLNDLIYSYQRVGMLCNKVSTDIVIKELQELKKSLKPSVPKFVADWYEENKHDLEFKIFDYINRFDQQTPSYFKDWINDTDINAIQILEDMHRFGYTIEKEKCYIVTIKGTKKTTQVLNYYIPDFEWLFDNDIESDCYRVKHTRKELEEGGFGSVFGNVLFEVEEVE